jgi:hypothetical protein
MTSPTKAKSCKENPDMIALKEIHFGLYQNLGTIMDFLVNADIKTFIDSPGNLSKLMLSRSMIEEIEKLSSTPRAEKIAVSLCQWQTELIFHYNRLIPQVKSQPYSTIIKFLEENFAVDLMQPIPISPRKSARLQARGKGSSPQQEAAAPQHETIELLHRKSPVARKLLLDFNGCDNSEPINVQTLSKPKTSPRV